MTHKLPLSSVFACVLLPTLNTDTKGKFNDIRHNLTKNQKSFLSAHVSTIFLHTEHGGNTAFPISPYVKVFSGHLKKYARNTHRKNLCAPFSACANGFLLAFLRICYRVRVFSPDFLSKMQNLRGCLFLPDPTTGNSGVPA